MSDLSIHPAIPHLIKSLPMLHVGRVHPGRHPSVPYPSASQSPHGVTPGESPRERTAVALLWHRFANRWRYDPSLSVGRYFRYWYTYRTIVAVLMAVLLSGLMYWLYTQQVACDSKPGSCLVYLSGHPEDRFVPQTRPDDNIVIVGLDNASVKDIGGFPVPRDRYATALQNLEKGGASTVAFDIGFPDARDAARDDVFAAALAKSKIPVVLAYGGDNVVAADGKVIQTSPTTEPPGVDQIPLRKFRCADTNSNPNTPCTQPSPNVLL